MGVTAVITAGGSSRRLGRDKGAESVGGQPLIARVASSLEPFEVRLLLCPDDRYASLGWPRAEDRLPGRGPLGGLATALAIAGTPWLAFSAADLPYLTPSYWRLLAGARCEGASAVVAEDAGGRLQPLAALYHQNAAAEVAHRLEAGQLAMHGLLKALPTVTLPWSALAGSFGEALFHNVNSEADLEAARRLLGP
ncbi:molybdenum cofactor guanylyltransferase [soil metagenome]|jgi:molybdopterin-guanine dinucleotide biosynthesis protein A|nr:molybdenum cofactor guanylyltransferase [Deinococcota bacterium]